MTEMSLIDWQGTQVFGRLMTDLRLQTRCCRRTSAKGASQQIELLLEVDIGPRRLAQITASQSAIGLMLKDIEDYPK